MKIKVRLTRDLRDEHKFNIIKQGDWIDLRAAEDVDMDIPNSTTLKRSTNTRNVLFDFYTIPLGIAMQLPKGYEAHVLPRSSTFKKFGIIQANSQGIIDETYCGNYDEWLFPAIALRKVHINKGDRICQFRIQLSQKATRWQKIKWLFNNKIKFEWVDNLEGENRGGIGSTGVR